MHPAQYAALLVTIPEACRMIGCGRTFLYRLVTEKKLRIVKLGRASRIPMADLTALVSEMTGEGACDAA